MAFIRQLRRDLVASPERFENLTLEDYLEALGSCLEGLHGSGSRHPLSPDVEPSWRFFAMLLEAGAGYE